MVEATGVGSEVTSLMPERDTGPSTWLRDHAQAIETELAALQG